MAYIKMRKRQLTFNETNSVLYAFIVIKNKAKLQFCPTIIPKKYGIYTVFIVSLFTYFMIVFSIRLLTIIFRNLFYIRQFINLWIHFKNKNDVKKKSFIQ